MGPLAPTGAESTNTYLSPHQGARNDDFNADDVFPFTGDCTAASSFYQDYGYDIGRSAQP